MKIFFHFSLSEYSNTYLIGPDDGGDAILIDPGHIDLELIQSIEENHYNIAYVLLTHRHATHTLGLGTLMKIYKPIVYAGSSTLYEYPVTTILDHTALRLSGICVDAIQIPGHSIDSFIFCIGDALFTGDVLFAGRIGSTNGVLERALLLKGIKQRLFPLDERIAVYPGHGAMSTLKIEKMFNHDLIDAMAMEDMAFLSHPSIIT